MRHSSNRVVVGIVVAIAGVVMLATMGRAVAFLAAALLVAYAFWLKSPPIEPRRVLPAYAFAVAAQILHLIEENRSEFYREFPPVLGAAPWGHTAWLVFNVTWLLVFALAGLGLVSRWQPAGVVALFLALGTGVLNGLGHFALALNVGGYFPGLLTAPLVFGAGCHLAFQVLRRRSNIEVPAI